jgi:hypothetical protein
MTKWTNELNRAFSTEEVQMLNEEMLNIPCHEGNANLHHIKIPPYYY